MGGMANKKYVMGLKVFVSQYEISDFDCHRDIVRRNCGGGLYSAPSTD